MNEIRRCRNTWMYCDGNCHNCETSATTSTTNLSSKRAMWSIGFDVRCSNCGYKLQSTGLPMYCPDCGCLMIH